MLAGRSDEESYLAFGLLSLLGRPTIAHDSEADPEYRHAINVLMKSGHEPGVVDLFFPGRRLVKAAIRLVNRPLFRRLWIVQEITLATTLEFRCGSSSTPGDVFFKAIQVLCSVVTDPPMPGLRNPYRNALKLGQLRAQVSTRKKQSFPHLAQTVSRWDCGRSHDRLIALLGLAFRDTEAWFTPSYSISGPELYSQFSKKHIASTGSLSMLHFAGCGDSTAHTIFQTEDQVKLQVNLPADDLPSWVPDWRVQSRPLTFSPDFEHSSNRYSATNSDPEFTLNDATLQVRARKIDKIKACGLPYYETLCASLDIDQNQTFNHWWNLAKRSPNVADAESMFASTLVGDGKVAVTENEAQDFNSADVPSMFKCWAFRTLWDFMGLCSEPWEDIVNDSTRYGYVAEEVCRDRTFFVTEAGRFGLGSNHVSPGDFVYLIHGLKTPFAVTHREPGMHVLRGECYVNGLMVGKVQHSDQDSFLNLI